MPYFHWTRYGRVAVTAATLINETIPTGSASERLSSGAPQRHLYAALLFLTLAVAEPRQFPQNRLSQAGSEIIKAIEHPVHF